MIEVIVAAAVLAIVALAVLSGIDGATSSTTREKARAIAANLAEQDQERLRAMPVDQLRDPPQTGDTVVDGVTYNVKSEAKFITDDFGGEPTCGSASTQVQYLHIVTTVTSAVVGKRIPRGVGRLARLAEQRPRRGRPRLRVLVMRQRLRQEDGFTLPELLTTMTIGMILVLATMTLVEVTMRRTGESQDRVEALQGGRIALDTMTRELRSRVCLPRVADVDAPQFSIDAASPDSITFFTDMRDTSTGGSTAVPAGYIAGPDKRTLTYVPDAAKPINSKIVESVYPAFSLTGSVYGYKATPLRTRRPADQRAARRGHGQRLHGHDPDLPVLPVRLRQVRGRERGVPVPAVAGAQRHRRDPAADLRPAPPGREDPHHLPRQRTQAR